MSEDSNNLEPFLPALDLRNKPDGGKGPLGKKDFCLKDPALVRNLQKMLKTLDYNLGSSGPDEDGVDGVFGNLTETAVKDFQEKNKDWDDEQLKVDGLVGPETSDALNRAMVGKWYDVYKTPKELTKSWLRVTATEDRFSDGVSIDPKGIKEAKIFLVVSKPVPAHADEDSENADKKVETS